MGVKEDPDVTPSTSERMAVQLAADLERYIEEQTVETSVVVLALCWMMADVVLLAQQVRGIPRDESYRTILVQLVACGEALANHARQESSSLQ